MIVECMLVGFVSIVILENQKKNHFINPPFRQQTSTKPINPLLSLMCHQSAETPLGHYITKAYKYKTTLW